HSTAYGQSAGPSCFGRSKAASRRQHRILRGATERGAAAQPAAWVPPSRIGALERTRIVEQGDSLLVLYRLALAA
ncbi:MAG: hypothetical protein ACRD5W_02630, partial [Candidatus Acidiferrales bacterium]